MTGLPSFLKAAALHYNMTQAQKDKVVDQVRLLNTINTSLTSIQFR